MAMYVPDRGPVIMTWTDCEGMEQQIRICRVRAGKYRGHLGINAPKHVRVVSQRLAKKNRNKL